MNPEQLFSLANMTAILGWLFLVIAPRWKWTQKIVLSGLIPLLLAGLYLYLIVAHFGESEGGFGSLEEVSQLFENPFALLAGWVHYLAFDLFVGVWEIRDSQKSKINHFFVIPCLFLTFMFGPIGLFLYFIIRTIKTKKFFVE